MARKTRARQMLERLAYADDNDAIRLIMALNAGSATPDMIKDADLSRITSIGKEGGNFTVNFVDRFAALQELGKMDAVNDAIRNSPLLRAINAGAAAPAPTDEDDDERCIDRPDDYDSPDYDSEDDDTGE